MIINIGLVIKTPVKDGSEDSELLVIYKSKWSFNLLTTTTKYTETLRNTCLVVCLDSLFSK